MADTKDAEPPVCPYGHGIMRVEAWEHRLKRWVCDTCGAVDEIAYVRQEPPR